MYSNAASPTLETPFFPPGLFTISAQEFAAFRELIFQEAGIADADKQKILWQNAAKLYKIAAG